MRIALDLTEEALELLNSGRTDAARMALESLAVHLSTSPAQGRWRLLEGLRQAGTHPVRLLRKVTAA